MGFTLSIIVPVYNGEKHIAHAVDRICGLSGDLDKEVIFVIDPKTDDNSKSLLEDIISKKELRDWKVLTMDGTGGIGPVRNRGLDVARGEFIWHMDIDDYPFPELPSIAIETMRKESADCFSFNYIRLPFNRQDDCDNVIPEHIDHDIEIYSGKDAVECLLAGKIPVTSWSNIYRRTKDIDELRFIKSTRAEDDHFTTRMMYLSDKVCFHRSPLYVYFYNPNAKWRKSLDFSDINGLYTDLEKWFSTRNKELESAVRLYKCRLIMHKAVETDLRTFMGVTRSDGFLKDLDSCDWNSVERFVFRHFPRLYYLLVRNYFKMKSEEKEGV